MLETPAINVPKALEKAIDVTRACGRSWSFLLYGGSGHIIENKGHVRGNAPSQGNTHVGVMRADLLGRRDLKWYVR